MGSDGPLDWYDLVIVLGGLSYKGQMFLAEPANNGARSRGDELLQLKPGLWGISIDLKAAWRRLVHWYSSQRR